MEGTHTYADETATDTPYLLTITLFNTAAPASSPLVVSATATVQDAALTAGSGLSLSAWPATPTGLVTVGTFTDANAAAPASDFTATIDWGNGNPETDGTVVATGGGGFAVQGNATYAATGSYTLTIHVADDGGSTTTLTGALSVSTPTAGLTATEGSPFSGTVATFTGDASLVSSVSIAWGDSVSSAGTVTDNGDGTFRVSGTHTYDEEGTYPLLVTVTLTSGGPLTAQGPALVADAALTAAGVTLSTTPGQPLALGNAPVTVATFTDVNAAAPASDFTASIDWGDGTETEGDVVGTSPGQFAVQGTHVYANAGGYPVQVTIDDEGGSSASATSTVNVSTVEGQDTSFALVVTAPAPTGGSASPGTDYVATITWGDGTTSNATVNPEPAGTGSLQVLVTDHHVYTDEGTYTVTATVSDPSGNVSSGSTTLTVQDAPLLGAGRAVSGVAGGALGAVAVANFTDLNTYASASDFAVTVSWGDGSSSSGAAVTVQADGPGAFTVVADHTYASAGSYTVTTASPTRAARPPRRPARPPSSPPGRWSARRVGRQQRRSDELEQSFLVPVGEASVDLNQGALRSARPSTSIRVRRGGRRQPGAGVQLRHRGRRAGHASCSCSPTRPASVPTSVQVQLTWDGVAQAAVTYDTSGQAAGAVYDLAVRPDDPVSASGVYGWSVAGDRHLQRQHDHHGDYFRHDLRGGAGRQPLRGGLGAGRRVAIADRHGWRGPGERDGRWAVLRQRRRRRHLQQPARRTSARWCRTWTAATPTPPRGRRSTTTTAAAVLTSVVDPHGLTLAYEYDGTGRLAQVTAPDGGVTTFSYDGTTGLLDSICEPGSRTVALTHDTAGNLTQITDVDGTTRTFGYDTAHRLTEDQYAPLDATFGYDSNGLLDAVDLGLGSSYTISSAAADGLGGSARRRVGVGRRHRWAGPHHALPARRPGPPAQPDRRRRHQHHDLLARRPRPGQAANRPAGADDDLHVRLRRVRRHCRRGRWRPGTRHQRRRQLPGVPLRRHLPPGHADERCAGRHRQTNTYDPTTGDLLTQIGCPGQHHDLHLLPDGRRLEWAGGERDHAATERHGHVGLPVRRRPAADRELGQPRRAQLHQL